MNLSNIKQLLTEHGIRLTKALGQNFLHDGNQLRRIVATAELNPWDKVLEIRPGLGPLTELLVAQAGEVCAIEKDARLVELLKEQHLRAAGIGMYFSEPKRIRTPRMRKSPPSPPLEKRVGERRPFPVRPNG